MNRTPIRLVTALCAGALTVTSLSACTSGDGGSDARLPGSTGNQAAESTQLATRWWSTPVSEVGTVIDYSAPTAGARGLRPSRADYCTVLSQTVKAGRSILPGAAADDPAVAVSTRAFVAETSALAPPVVARSWTVLGTTLVKVAASGGDLRRVSGVDARATARAASIVARDAATRCHVNLSTPVR